MTSTEIRQIASAESKPNLAAVPAAVTHAPALAVAMEAPPAEPIYGTHIPNRIFVGGISRDTTETDLMIAFSAYGAVRSTKIIVDQDGFNKGYGFVTFETEMEAQRLQSVGNCVVLRNRRLNIAPAFKKQIIRQKQPLIIDANGTVYYAAQVHPTVPNNIQVATTANFIQAGSVTDFAGPAVPAIYQQAPVGIQFQPVYQYYSVPVNVQPAWPQNYYQEPQLGNPINPFIPQEQTAWEFDGGNQNNWRAS